MLHRVRFMLVKQHTMLANAIRVHLVEVGLVAKSGRERVLVHKAVHVALVARVST
jgi:hypothetical protein